MKYAHSIMFGDIVDANDFNYDECKELLLICPICREKVFKRVRGEKHFFCHHKRTDENSDCDLRVDRMTKTELVTISSICRGQTIEAFFQQLNDVVLHSVTANDDEFSRLKQEVKDLMDNVNFRKWYASTPHPICSPYREDPKQFRDPGGRKKLLVQFVTLGQTYAMICLGRFKTTCPYNNQELIDLDKIEGMPTKICEFREKFIFDVGNIMIEHPLKVDWKFLFAFTIIIMSKAIDNYYKLVQQENTTISLDSMIQSHALEIADDVYEINQKNCNRLRSENFSRELYWELIYGSFRAIDAIKNSGTLGFAKHMNQWKKSRMSPKDYGSKLMVQSLLMVFGLLYILPSHDNFQNYVMDLARKHNT